MDNLKTYLGKDHTVVKDLETVSHEEARTPVHKKKTYREHTRSLQISEAPANLLLEPEI